MSKTAEEIKAFVKQRWLYYENKGGCNPHKVPGTDPKYYTEIVLCSGKESVLREILAFIDEITPFQVWEREILQ